MRGFVVSRGGTFGTVSREYVSESGVPHVVICWGPQGWSTPVRLEDVYRLKSAYESDAKKEAKLWLEALRPARVPT